MTDDKDHQEEPTQPLDDEAPAEAVDASTQDNTDTPIDIDAVADKLGLQDHVDVLRRISPEEILWLLDHCPFLQLVDTKISVGAEEPDPQFITAKSGWTIHDYGNAFSTSPGLLLFGGGDYTYKHNRDKDDKEGGTIINPGHGTLANQIFMTASEMIDIAIARSWEGVLIVDGHPSMQWAAWVEGYDKGLYVEGYEPDANDFAKRKRLRRSSEELDQLYRNIKSVR